MSKKRNLLLLRLPMTMMMMAIAVGAIVVRHNWNRPAKTTGKRRLLGDLCAPSEPAGHHATRRIASIGGVSRVWRVWSTGV
jgi:hypothetical protein